MLLVHPVYRGAQDNILIGLAKTIHIQCIYSNFGREITKYTVIYGVYIRFWPTLHINIVMLGIRGEVRDMPLPSVHMSIRDESQLATDARQTVYILSLEMGRTLI